MFDMLSEGKVTFIPSILQYRLRPLYHVSAYEPSAIRASQPAMNRKGLHSAWLVFALLAACDREPIESPGRPQTALTVQTHIVQPQTLQDGISIPGSLVSWDQVELRVERPGVISEILFTEGAQVSRGDVLVTIDSSELEAELLRAQARLTLAEGNERRQSELLKTRGISPADYEASVAELDDARAHVALIRAQLAKTELKAPFDGVVGLRRVSTGAYVTHDTAITTVHDNTRLRLDFSIPERYASLINTGSDVMFQVAGLADAFPARIYAMEPAVDVQTRSRKVRAEVDNSAGRLVPGSFADVQVQLEEIAHALTIPPEALIPGYEQQSVFVNNEGVAELRAVQTGLRTGTKLQILSGLEPGDAVITTGLLQLRPGMKVQTATR